MVASNADRVGFESPARGWVGRSEFLVLFPDVSFPSQEIVRSCHLRARQVLQFQRCEVAGHVSAAPRLDLGLVLARGRRRLRLSTCESLRPVSLRKICAG
jgi:hypothetical protein